MLASRRPMPHRLCRALLGARAATASSDALERRLEELVGEAAKGWPELEVDGAAFLSYVGARLGDRAGLPALEALKLADLYLAFACSRGVPGALRRFEAAYLARLDAEMTRARFSGDVEEVKQLLRTRFFVAPKGEEPAICQYSGEGALGGWVQVSVMRELLRLRDRQRRETALDDDALPAALVSSDSAELSHLRQRYRDEFAKAFRDALERLDTQERLLLRHHYLDGLSIDELGRLQRTHRSTAARRVVKAREALFEVTRELLRERLDLGAAELESILREVRSRLDVSLGSLDDA